MTEIELFEAIFANAAIQYFKEIKNLKDIYSAMDKVHFSEIFTENEKDQIGMALVARAGKIKSDNIYRKAYLDLQECNEVAHLKKAGARFCDAVDRELSEAYGDLWHRCKEWLDLGQKAGQNL